MATKALLSSDVTIEPANAQIDVHEPSSDGIKSKHKSNKTSQKPGTSSGSYFYSATKRTILGRDSVNWIKLSIFYTIFYFFLGCFFVLLTYIFASLLDRIQPRYYNTESTMAVRSATAVVGMGFRPQPIIHASLIRITNNTKQQNQMASSLRIFRNTFLLQNPESKVEECSEKKPALSLPPGIACALNWYRIVNSDEHPCSEKNLFGFSYEEPCILVKLNKVYGWKPMKGVLPLNIQQLSGVYNNKSISNPDVYVTCEGTHPTDNDVITKTTYYSLAYPLGSSNIGVIPNHFFPYRNAKDHVQPFVLVQFNKLPLNRLVSITCRAWAPGIEHNAKRMRGMVSFQLYRTHKSI